MLRISKDGSWGGAVFILKWVVMVFMAYYLYVQLTDQSSSIFLLGTYSLVQLPIVFIVIALSFINWSLEAKKWQFLTANFANLTFWESLKGILSGLACSMIIPMGIGDNVGRLSYLKGSKLKGISLGYLGGFIQLLVTAGFGFFGIYYLLEAGGSFDTQTYLSIVALMGLMVVLMASLSNGNFSWARVGLLGTALSALTEIKSTHLMGATSMAILRYMVFVLQLYLLFRMMDLGLSADTIFAGITWIYICKSVIPTFNFVGDIGVREFSAVLFFGLFNVPALQVILPVTILWLINIFLPSVLGMYYLAQIKLASVRLHDI